VVAISKNAQPFELDEPGAEHKTDLVRWVLLGEVSPEQACAEEGISQERLTEWIREHRRAARRAIDDQISQTLAAHGLEKEDFVLSGNLENMGLSDLLEAVQLGRKNAHIRIEHGGEYSHLWCSDGDVIDAESGKLVGTAAVYHLLSLQEGRLQAEFSSVARERTVIPSTEALLVEYARRVDERQAFGEGAPHSGVADVGAGIEIMDAARTQVSSLPRADAEFNRIALFPRISELPETSVPPVAPVSRAALLLSELPRGRTAYGIGAAAIVLAFATGFWGARPSAAPAVTTAAAAQSSALALGAALCGPGMDLVTAGVTAAGTTNADSALRPFCLAERAVTTEEYGVCVASQRCEAAQTESTAGREDLREQPSLRCNAGQPGRERSPINCITPRQAEQYCEWRGQRLPLPAEWEFAWQSTRASSRNGEPLGSPSFPGASSEWTKDPVAHPHRGVEPSEPLQSYAVLRAGSSLGVFGGEARPSRLYMSATAHGRNIGFRCALSLESAATLPR
jgi:hypothetical protein